MRIRWLLLLMPALLSASCGGDGSFFSTSPDAGTSHGSTSTMVAGSSTTAGTEGTSGTTSAGPSTTGSGGGVQYVWERVPRASVPSAPGKQAMSGIVPGGPGLVAVGWDLSSGFADAAVWTSPDGFAWGEVVLPEAGNQYMVAVTTWGPGLVAVGYESRDQGEVAAVWTSSDGTSWSRVPHDEAVFGGPGIHKMLGVTEGGPGLVAVGVGVSGEDEAAAVWVSSDATAWSRIDDVAVLGGPGGQGMHSVAAGGRGVVAVGFDFQGGLWDGAVWTSPDGFAWSRVADPHGALGGDGTQWINAVTAGGPGFVAVGFDIPSGNKDGAIWTSPDGLVWSRVPHDDALFGGAGTQEMLGVAAGGFGVVAVGVDESGVEGDAAVWVSADGLTWTRVLAAEIFGGAMRQSMLAVTVGGPGVVAVGLERNPDGGAQQAAVWVGRSPG